MSDRKLNPVAKELISAKKRIENPKNWCQYGFEIDGRECAWQAASHYSWEVRRRLRQSCLELFNESSLMLTNDCLGHAAVMRAFDHAISRALAGGTE